jgi:hypothetical protein
VVLFGPWWHIESQADVGPGNHEAETLSAMPVELGLLKDVPAPSPIRSLTNFLTAIKELLPDPSP